METGGGQVLEGVVLLVVALELVRPEPEAEVQVPHDRREDCEPFLVSAEETPAGTLITWNVIQGAYQYNVIRGRLDRLTETSEAIDLGPVTCIEAASRDGSTEGFEDQEIPAPGEAFFYLAEYEDGGVRSYGSPWAAKPRVPGPGSCP